MASPPAGPAFMALPPTKESPALSIQTPRRLQNRSLAKLIADMKSEGSMPREEVIPSPCTINNYLRKRSLIQWIFPTSTESLGTDATRTTNTTQGSSVSPPLMEVTSSLNTTPIKCLSDKALRRITELTSPDWHNSGEDAEEAEEATAAAAASAADSSVDVEEATPDIHPAILSPVVDLSADDFPLPPASPASIYFSIWDNVPGCLSSIDSSKTNSPVHSVYRSAFMDHDKHVHSS